MPRLLLILVVALLGSVAVFGQQTDKRKYALPRKVLPLEKALIKLSDAGAVIVANGPLPIGLLSCSKTQS